MTILPRLSVFRHFTLWALGLAAPQTQTTEAERACLRRHASGRRWIAEIGVWHGVTTRALREVMAPDGVLLAIDPFGRGRLGVSLHRIIAARNVTRSKGGEVRWVRMLGADAGRQHAAMGAPPIELLFIDGDHTYDAVRDDWEAWSSRIAPGGVVALHDSRSSADRQIDDAGSARFTREVIARDPRFTVIDAVDSVTVVRRNGGPASS
jgi:predicted O-methyltransferase YrrM